MKPFLFALLLSACTLAQAQQYKFSEADSLRGTLSPLRTCYDVRFYDLNIAIDFATKRISGYNEMVYHVRTGFNMLQIDLFSNMKVDSVVHKGKRVKFHRKHDAVFIDLGEMQEADRLDTLRIYYQGQPRIAVNAPWDGGFTWTKDRNGKDWVAVSCEGIGASLWWPNKDHLSDEPDSMRIRCTVPSEFECISNGNLRAKTENPKPKKKGKKQPAPTSTTTYDWFVSYPINNYNVTLAIGDYVHFSDTFTYSDGEKLPLDYYVLSYNLDKAKKQFKETPQTLRVMEKYLDKYPFPRDGFGMVETPYLGMEHQGAIAYGNKFMPGYLGSHPQGIPFDYIIMHEAAHEWWGNSISCFDHAELWIHESFTTYMESVYVEETYGVEARERYLRYQRGNMYNSQPIVGPKDVNFNKHNNDIYYKGALMLHTLRNTMPSDEQWWKILKAFYQKHKITNVRTEDFISYIKEQAGTETENYDSFFEQFLFKKSLPTLLYRVKTVGSGIEVELKLESAEVENLNFGISYQVGKDKPRMRVWVNSKDWTVLRIEKAKPTEFSLMQGLYQERKMP